MTISTGSKESEASGVGALPESDPTPVSGYGSRASPPLSGAHAQSSKTEIKKDDYSPRFDNIKRAPLFWVFLRREYIFDVHHATRKSTTGAPSAVRTTHDTLGFTERKTGVSPQFVGVKTRSPLQIVRADRTQHGRIVRAQMCGRKSHPKTPLYTL